MNDVDDRAGESLVWGCFFMSGRPRKVLVGWSELLAWLEGEGVSRHEVLGMKGRGAPAWRHPPLLPGRSRNRLYVVGQVAAWLAERKKRKPLVQRHTARGTFTKKLYETE